MQIGGGGGGGYCMCRDELRGLSHTEWRDTHTTIHTHYSHSYVSLIHSLHSDTMVYITIYPMMQIYCSYRAKGGKIKYDARETRKKSVKSLEKRRNIKSILFKLQHKAFLISLESCNYDSSFRKLTFIPFLHLSNLSNVHF